MSRKRAKPDGEVAKIAYIKELEENNRDQLETLFSEFIDLLKGKENRAFAKRWFDETYKPARVMAFDLWTDFLHQANGKISIDDGTRIDLFRQLEKHLWPKYLQAGLNAVAKHFKTNPIKLIAQEFEELPHSAMLNVADINLFENYCLSDMQMEVCRAFKLLSAQELGRNQAERDAQQRRCLQEFLGPDEKLIYNKLLEKLKPNQMWGKSQTQNYLQLSLDEWAEDLELMKQELEEYRRDNKSEKRAQSADSERPQTRKVDAPPVRSKSKEPKQAPARPQPKQPTVTQTQARPSKSHFL